jgi:hypothetical protein
MVPGNRHHFFALWGGHSCLPPLILMFGGTPFLNPTLNQKLNFKSDGKSVRRTRYIQHRRIQ